VVPGALDGFEHAVDPCLCRSLAFVHHFGDLAYHQLSRAIQRVPFVRCQESENKEIEISNRSIICWALVEFVGENAGVQTQVRGIEQDSSGLGVVEDLIHTDKVWQDGADRNQYFLGYNDPDAHKESDHWIKQANDRLRTEKEKRLQKKTGQAAFRAAS
jgi:hypothetical protein